MSRSATPVSDKDRKNVWRQSLESRGIVIADETSRSMDFSIVDCDQTRESLSKIVKLAFPTCKIISFGNHGGYEVTLPSGKPHFDLKDITLLIYDYAEIAALPMPVEEKG